MKIKSISFFKTLLAYSTFFLISCTTVNNNGPDCSNTSILVFTSFTNSSTTSSSGSITITSPIGSEYTYKINTGVYQSSPVFNNLAPGNYLITAKNGAGCTGATNVIISSLDCAGSNINVTTTTTANSISVTSPIGSGYTYSLNAGPYQSNPIFTELSTGTYTVIARNSSGCVGATSVVLTSFNCSSINISVNASVTTNSINITNPIGSQYTYSLNGGVFQSSPVFSGLPPGYYNITAKDANGCTGTNSFDLSGTGCNTLAGIDTGSHTLFIGALNPGFAPIRDTLSASVSGSNVSIFSKALGRTLNGYISGADCNSIQFDSIISGMGDTLYIPGTTLPVPNGVIKIWNLRAGGNGTITSSGLNTIINIAKGNTNITSPVDISNLSGLNMNLKGRFLKLP